MSVKAFPSYLTKVSGGFDSLDTTGVKGGPVDLVVGNHCHDGQYLAKEGRFPQDKKESRKEDVEKQNETRFVWRELTFVVL
jgi:hypothetical protein